jgi:hypothetical protein
VTSERYLQTMERYDRLRMKLAVAKIILLLSILTVKIYWALK